MRFYAFTILIGAFLLFQVEPVIAKIILPWFGGSAAVWTVCLLFFQLALLAGYLYAHALIRYLRPRAQMLVHATLLTLSALTLPIYPGPQWKPAPLADPTWGIVSLLAAKIGIPFFLLASTAPLLQAWYARRARSAKPYRLYALSNAGSMFALLSYPFLFEPVFSTHRQATMWSAAYGVFIVFCAITAFRSSGAVELNSGVETASDSAKPTKMDYWLWLTLPAVASVLLLAITNHLSQNVAAIPFLWVLPLSIYLLSFILCFAGDWYRRNPYLQLLAVALGTMAYSLGADMAGDVPVVVMVPLFSIGLFICCMVCHGELARLKPHPRYLTHFYLMISAGGALGGVLVGLAAPHLLNAFYELPLGMVACAALVVIVLKLDPQATDFQRWSQPGPLLAVALTAALAIGVGVQIRNYAHGSRLLVRNFYGGLKVKDSGPSTDRMATRRLTHGTINHGEQFLFAEKRDLPTTYYGPNTGIGVAIREKEKIGAIRVGVIGLGTGTVAVYGRSGDDYRFYEINPLVPWIARTQFTFLNDCRARLEIVMGDARLSLERESPENFDVLAVDAFSGDSIPVHLLTREAIELYFRHLKPDGILAVHISNRYLDLQPVLMGESQALGKSARVVETHDDSSHDALASVWVLLVSPPTHFNENEIAASEPLAPNRTVRMWTDDYSNLFSLLK
ncbi:MAG: fused MFS/spermidine synthase [Candidatus Acidiferrales bacterium]